MVPNAVVFYDSTALSTTFMNDTVVQATVPSGLVTAEGTAQVFVVNPTPGGGASAAATFTIGAPGADNPVPTIVSVTGTINTQGAASPLTVVGTNFVASSVVNMARFTQGQIAG